MGKLLTALVAVLVFVVSLDGMAAPDETQKMITQRAQEAKKKLDAAQAAKGAERDKIMQEHMKMMQAMMEQMQKARPRDGLSAAEMREWIDEHIKLMDEMMAQMMGEQQMMMHGGGMGMGGMPGSGQK